MPQSIIKLKGNTYYIDSAVNIGLISDDNGRTVIIDTGLDDDMGRRILNLMKEQNLTPTAIINTHSHADHCGGNNFIVKRTGIPVYASYFEKQLIECPLIEPFYLFSASPLKDMKNKFLMAKESRVDHIIEEGEVEIQGIPLKIISLSGHSPGMIGVVSNDGVLFAGDAFFSPYILEKHGLAYYTDIKNTLKCLEYLKNLKYDYFVPSHGDVLEDPIPVIEVNIKRINEITEDILGLCSQPKSREEITAYMIDRYKIKLTIGQYYLTSSTISAYLSYLTDEGMMTVEISENNLKWKRI